MWATKETISFCNPDHIMLGIGYGRVVLGGQRYTLQDQVIPATQNMTQPHIICYICCLFNSRNVAGSTALAEVCTLLSAVLVSGIVLSFIKGFSCFWLPFLPCNAMRKWGPCCGPVSVCFSVTFVHSI